MTTVSQPTAVSLPLAIGRFTRHFLEMCVVMCAGGAALNIAVFGAAAALGRPRLVAEAPELSIVIVAFDLALAMAIYMAVRGHPVRHNVEMSGGTLLGAIPFIGALWAGLLPSAKLESWISLFAFMCGPLCLLMLVLMAIRFDHYGGRVGKSSAVAASSTEGDYTCSMHPEVRLAAPGKCPICGMRLSLR
jgi:hypothetical protein